MLKNHRVDKHYNHGVQLLGNQHQLSIVWFLFWAQIVNIFSIVLWFSLPTESHRSHNTLNSHLSVR